MNTQIRNYNVYQPANRRLDQGPPRRKPKKLLSGKPLQILLALLIVFCAGLYINHSVKAAAREAEAAAQAVRRQEQKDFSTKAQVLIAENDQIDFSVTAVDLKTGEAQSIGDQKPMNAASTTKLLTAIYYLREVEQGKKNISDNIAWYSGMEAVKQLINRSDDTVWDELNESIGKSNLNAFAKSIGASDYDASTNKIGVKSMAVVLKKLYKNELLNKANTDILLSFMQNTNYENFIPPAVSKNLTLHHKVGLVEDYVNDAAVISDGKNSFVLVIYTDGNGMYNWGQRAELMQNITKLAIEAYL